MIYVKPAMYASLNKLTSQPKYVSLHFFIIVLFTLQRQSGHVWFISNHSNIHGSQNSCLHGIHVNVVDFLSKQIEHDDIIN